MQGGVIKTPQCIWLAAWVSTQEPPPSLPIPGILSQLVKFPPVDSHGGGTERGPGADPHVSNEIWFGISFQSDPYTFRSQVLCAECT